MSTVYLLFLKFATDSSIECQNLYLLHIIILCLYSTKMTKQYKQRNMKKYKYLDTSFIVQGIKCVKWFMFLCFAKH